jgi:aspartokinase/homoserine dehydrogenase 1
LRVENGFSILALVGDNMRNHTGVSGKMFATLGSQGINIRAIAQGSSRAKYFGDYRIRKTCAKPSTRCTKNFSRTAKQINFSSSASARSAKN